MSLPETSAAPAIMTIAIDVSSRPSIMAAPRRRAGADVTVSRSDADGFACVAMNAQNPSNGDFGARSRRVGSGSSVVGRNDWTRASASSGDIPTALANVRM